MALRAIIIFLTIGNLSTLHLFGSEFTKTVLPILQKKCISCHREPYKTKYGRIKKPKGKLILNTPNGIKKGFVKLNGVSADTLFYIKWYTLYYNLGQQNRDMWYTKWYTNTIFE